MPCNIQKHAMPCIECHSAPQNPHNMTYEAQNAGNAFAMKCMRVCHSLAGKAVCSPPQVQCLVAQG
jgi:hypothetical protein